MKEIWIVSYFCNGIVVTAFENEDAAKKCFEYFSKKYKYAEIDKAPVFKHFNCTDNEE